MIQKSPRCHTHIYSNQDISHGYSLDVIHAYSNRDIINACMAIIHVYGVATISRLLKIIGLLCKRALSKRLYSAKETYNFKEPTNRSHPIVIKTSYLYIEESRNHCNLEIIVI